MIRQLTTKIHGGWRTFTCQKSQFQVKINLIHKVSMVFPYRIILTFWYTLVEKIMILDKRIADNFESKEGFLKEVPSFPILTRNISLNFFSLVFVNM